MSECSLIDDWSIQHGFIPSTAADLVSQYFLLLSNTAATQLNSLQGILSATSAFMSSLPATIGPLPSCPPNFSSINVSIGDSPAFTQKVDSLMSQINNLLGRVNSLNFPSIPNIEQISFTDTLMLPYQPSTPTINYPQTPSIQQVTVPNPPNITLRSDYPVLVDPPQISLPHDVPDVDVDVPPPFEIDFSKIQENFNKIDEAKNELKSTLLSYINEMLFDIEEMKTFIPSNINTNELINALLVFEDKQYLDGFTPDILSTFEHAQTKAVNDLLLKSQNGFSLPPAFVMANIKDLTGSFRDKRLELMYDYNKHKLSLYHDGLKFRHELGFKILSFAKEFDLKIFGVLTELFKSKSELIRTFIDVNKFLFEQELQLIKATLEYYKQILEYYMAKFKYSELVLSVNNQKIELFKTRMSAEAMKIDLYAKQIDAIKTRVDIINSINQAEKMKIDIYAAVLQGLSILSQLNKDRISLYSEQIKGEGLKIEAYKSSIQAYQTLLSARIAEFEGKLKAALGKADLQKSLFSTYSSYYDALKGIINGYSSTIDSITRPINGLAQIYSSLIGKATAEANLKAQLIESEARVFLADLETKQKHLESKVRLEIAKADLMGNILRSQAGVVGQVCASALSGIHVASQITATAHDSITETYSKSKSESCSEQYIQTV